MWSGPSTADSLSTPSHIYYFVSISSAVPKNILHWNQWTRFYTLDRRNWEDIAFESAKQEGNNIVNLVHQFGDMRRDSRVFSASASALPTLLRFIVKFYELFSLSLDFNIWTISSCMPWNLQIFYLNKPHIFLYASEPRVSNMLSIHLFRLLKQ